MKHSLQYLNPDSSQSLREGIAELRKAEGAEGDAMETISEELLPDIEIHDAIHVLFACSTDLRGEIFAHVWTIFGTTMQMKEMKRVNLHQDHKSALKDIGHRHLLRTWLRNVPKILGTILRSFRMKRRWPAREFSRFLDRPLKDLRREFGIVLAT